MSVVLHSYVALLIAAVAVLVLNAGSATLRRHWLPEPLIALLIGFLVGPHALGWMHFTEGFRDPALLHFARFTLAIGLMGIALRLPYSFWQRHWSYVALILGAGMPLMWVISSLVLHWGLGMELALAFLIGAIMAPTDPIVSTPVVTGEVAIKNLSPRLRRNLSAESGLNDGLGYLFVLLPMLFIEKQQQWGSTLHEWSLRVLLYQVIGAAVLGMALGWVGALLLRFAEKHDSMARAAYLGFTLALSLVIISLGEVLHVDAILSVIVGGVVFSLKTSERTREQIDHTQETINRFFLIPVFIAIGIALPLDHWREFVGWWGVLVVLLALVLRRVGTVLLLSPFMKRMMPRGEVIFLGWVGPVGVAALFYAMHTDEKLHDPRIWAYTSLAITLSVFVHGMSATPLSRWLNRHHPQEEESNER